MTSISELTFFGTPIQYFKEIESTSDYLKSIDIIYPLLVIADLQNKGRGQYGRTWESECSQNLCFSFQYFPKNLAIEQGFKISQCIALAVIDSINEQISPDKSYIKWPNDIILKDKKVCGLLIESISSQSMIQKVIIGIGLNVNQEVFPSLLSNAGSLKSFSGTNPIDRSDLLSKIISKLEERLQQGMHGNLQTEYNACLYKMNQEVTLSRNGVKSPYINLGVNEQGHWMVRSMEDNQVLEIVSSREVKYVYG